MDRKLFLKKGLGLAGIAAVAPVMLRSKNIPDTSAKTLGKNRNVLVCTVTNSETEGPFPTITPANYVRTNIIGDRTGVAFTMNIYIMNTNANCNAYQGVFVDVWHCDKDGNYSQYGGTGMQPTNYTAYNFLRGRQTTNAAGMVTFTSIFPGWYNGRATHIHIHVYKADGTSLLVTQIAFPEGNTSSNAVYNVNVNGTSYGYTKGMNGYTYNANDNVFSDGTSNEMSVVTGSLSGGYTLTHTIYVAGSSALAALEVSENSFKVEQNYPNPFRGETVFPITLKSSSKVSIELYDLSGKKITTVINGQKLSSGLQKITLSGNQLQPGMYMAKIYIENSSGSFHEMMKILVE
ncbi:T9SS type A sorting domain-containing protein [Chryseobacterium sp. Tr-659]|uniref:T9SS type A sorting domain-containing protein n=1 Tax=Chryseobacterium sp. Tr-659 TaxID=2608340 RepID=UPI0014205773|nr:T9SS type A sorting domain-containing protein [Chryseobacterium sp. Tr-659]NIF07011.1 T9SS type A sorting domain-containing protein [Chryseobacterium sp. Tr-659]